MTAPSTRRLLALTATLVVGALGVLAGLVAPAGASSGSASAHSVRSFPPDRPTRVLIVGDSVMLGAAPQDTAHLPGRDVTVDAMVNRSTHQAADVVAQHGTDWDVVVVLIGHNDGGSPGVYQPAMRQILDEVKGVPRVVFLTIHEARPYYADVNRFLATLPAQYPNLRIGDWNAIANQHPDAMSSDGLHLNGQGADLMATLVADQVAQAERELGPKPTTTTAAPTTTTTTPPTTTTDPPTTTTTKPVATTTAVLEAAVADAPAPAAPRPPPVDDGSPPAVAWVAVAAAVVVMVAYLLVARSRRRALRHSADTAG
ncbi:hypothetical protein [Aquihabitans sp. McL0605]|uniref:hypothetical protein n=1 Tax=Aquihabitans sp. McL0605 TaxID=3415671 RepID=UPI003CF4A9D1